MVHKSVWTEQKAEDIIGNLLRAGVSVAAVTVLVGGCIYLAHHGLSRADYRGFHGEPSDLKEWRGILRDARDLDGRGIIQLGLVWLIATPVARVAFSAFAFAKDRDWLYVGVTALVFCVLMYSMVGWAL